MPTETSREQPVPALQLEAVLQQEHRPGCGSDTYRFLLWLNVGGLQPLGALLDFKLNLLPFGKDFEPRASDGAEVNEDIRAAVVLRDKPEPFGFVKPFHCA